MNEDDDIRVFLESPYTHEPLSEADIKPRPSPVTRRVKRRKEKLPPYIPFKSIYEENDLSKLTERQRILALKFQSSGRRPTSLFLAVNDISRELPVTATEDVDRSTEECHDADRSLSCTVGCHDVDRSTEGCHDADRSLSCTKGCREDAIRLCEFLEWLMKDDGRRKGEIKSVLATVNRLMVDEECICSSEDRIYKKVYGLLGYDRQGAGLAYGHKLV